VTCGNCNSTVAARVRVWFEGKEKREACDICGGLPSFWIPDVYLGGPGGSARTDENLCNPKTGEPIPFSTKREKAAVMNMLKLRQSDSAERQHGSRIEYGKRKKYFI
jgi:hypothetical protein